MSHNIIEHFINPHFQDWITAVTKAEGIQKTTNFSTDTIGLRNPSFVFIKDIAKSV